MNANDSVGGQAIICSFRREASIVRGFFVETTISQPPIVQVVFVYVFNVHKDLGDSVLLLGSGDAPLITDKKDKTKHMKNIDPTTDEEILPPTRRMVRRPPPDDLLPPLVFRLVGSDWQPLELPPQLRLRASVRVCCRWSGQKPNLCGRPRTNLRGQRRTLHLPLLLLSLSRISWSTNCPDFVLESAGQLAGTWTSVPGITGYSGTLPVNAGTNQFFRLRK
jgi:hypothetical protein